MAAPETEVRQPETEHLAALAEKVDEYRQDLTSYCVDCLVIRNKQAKVVPFTFNFAQRFVHARLAQQMRETGRVRAIILKARQEGISTYVAARNYRRVQLYENQRALVIADQRKRGQVLFGIYEMFDRRIPDWIKPEKRWQRSGWRLHYDNPHGTGLNSELSVETAMDAAAGRGSTVQAVHASELGFWENPEEVWISLMQAVPDFGSEVIIESTANGVGNFFHQMWEDAVAGDSSFLPIFLPWWIHEEYRLALSPEEKKQLRRELDPWEKTAHTEGFEWEQPDDVVPTEFASGATWNVATQTWTLSLEQLAWRRMVIRDKLRGDLNGFRQEYPSTAREAFLVSGDMFFDEDALLWYEQAAARPRKRQTIRWHLNGAYRRDDSNGELRVWQRRQKDHEYVIFADTASGKKAGERESIFASDREQGGRDFSAAWVYDKTKGQYVAKLHGRIPPEAFAQKLMALGYTYASSNKRSGREVPALLGVERNHKSGETVVRILKDDLRYPNLYYDRQLNRRLNRRTPAAGWVTTESKRTIMLDEFSAEIRARGVSMPDPDTIREMFTFVRNDDGKPEAQEGCHDDRVIAAAGCIQMARFAFAPAVRSERKLVRRGGPVGHLEEER